MALLTKQCFYPDLSKAGTHTEIIVAKNFDHNILNAMKLHSKRGQLGAIAKFTKQ